MRFLAVFLFVLFAHNAVAFDVRIADKGLYHLAKADTPDKLAQGLMFVKELPEDEGMWFDLRKYVKPAMWMKNTYIPLDMLFVGCDFELKDIYYNAKPLSLEKIISESDFCYVIEVNGGESEKHNFAVGDKITVVLQHKTM